MTSKFRFDPCETCCVIPCVTFEDHFLRPDSDDVNSDWTEHAGEWSIASNKLTCSSASALIECNTPHPTINVYCAVTISTDVLNCGGRIVLDYVDESNCLFAEATLTNAASRYWMVRLGARVDGSETILQSYLLEATSDSVVLNVCVDSDGQQAMAWLVGSASSATLQVAIERSDPSGEVRLATTSTAGLVSFDDFAIRATATDNPSCAGCENWCPHGPREYAPNEYEVVIDGVANYTGFLQCTTCENLNNTFQCVKSYGEPYCEAKHSVSICGCDMTLEVRWRFPSEFSNHYVLEVRVVNTTPSVTAITWRKDFGTTRPSVADIASLDVPLHQNALRCGPTIPLCDLTSATCTITASELPIVP